MAAVNSSRVWDKAVVGDGEVASLLGEVICWSMRGESGLSAVRESLVRAGFSPEEAKKFAPDMRIRNAFARVAEKLEKTRIVKRLRESETHIHYQFNKANRVAAVGDAGDAAEKELFDFPYEGIVTLGKTSGDIDAKDPELRDALTAALARTLTVRTASDVTLVVQRLFENWGKAHADGDLFPVRDGGAVYFALSSSSGFIDRVQAFVEELGGAFRRFPIPAGTKEGTQSVAATIQSGMAGLIHEYRAAIARLSEANRPDTIQRIAAKVALIREKIKIHEAYLGSARESLESAAGEAEEELRSKLIEIAARGEDEAAEGEADTAVTGGDDDGDDDGESPPAPDGVVDEALTSV